LQIILVGEFSNIGRIKNMELNFPLIEVLRTSARAGGRVVSQPKKTVLANMGKLSIE